MADHVVALDVHDVGLDFVHDAPRNLVRGVRGHKPVGFVRRRLVRCDAVNGSLRPMLNEGWATVVTYREDVDFVAALGQVGCQAVAEHGRAVDVGRVGIASDEDSQWRFLCHQRILQLSRRHSYSFKSLPNLGAVGCH